jgi:hypothetical protein
LAKASRAARVYGQASFPKSKILSDIFSPWLPVVVVNTQGVDLAAGCTAPGWQGKHQYINYQ